jgi:hypothetical protein
MKLALRLFGAVHLLMALLFTATSLLLMAMAANVGWQAATTGLTADAAQRVIEAIGLLAAAVVALQIAQTVLEEEVIRDAHISAPTRVRRFLSRFLVILVVALAIEGLVATFKAVHEDLAQLAYAAALIIAAGVLLAAWGVFIRTNRSAEELEPEAMDQAKREDAKVGNG